MLTWHSFLQSVMFFVRSISVKLTKKHYRSSSVLMSGAVVIAVVAFSANGFGGGGKNAMAAPRTVESLEADEEPETEALLEGSSFVTEAKLDYKKALFKEQADENSKQWYNIIVAKKDWETSPKADAIKKVIAAYHTDEVKKVIEETSDGLDQPVW